MGAVYKMVYNWTRRPVLYNSFKIYLVFPKIIESITYRQSFIMTFCLLNVLFSWGQGIYYIRIILQLFFIEKAITLVFCNAVWESKLKRNQSELELFGLKYLLVFIESQCSYLEDKLKNLISTFLIPPVEKIYHVCVFSLSP